MSQPEKVNPNLTKILEAIETTKKEILRSFETRLSELEKAHTPTEPQKLEGKVSEHADVDVDSTEPTSAIISGHLRKCPDCYEAVAKEAYGLVLDSECEGCGKPVNEKSEKCPFCGGTKARKRSK